MQLNGKLRSVAVLVVFLCALRSDLAAAKSSGKAWENVIIDNKTGYWRTFSYWKTPQLITKGGKLKPLREAFDPKRKKHKTPADRAALPIRATDEPPKNWRKAEFDHKTWPRQTGTYGPGHDHFKFGIYGPGNPTELATICLRGKFQVFKPEAMKDLQVTLEYHGGVVVYINGKEIKRAHLPFGRLKLDTLADRYPMSAYVKQDFEKTKDVRLRKTTALIRPNMVKKGINVVAIEVHRAPIHEILDETPVNQRVKVPFWAHAHVKRATLHSGWGLTPKTAVTSVDEPIEERKPPGKDILNNTAGYWRTFTRWKTVEVVTDKGRSAPLKAPPTRGRKYGEGKPIEVFSTPDPPNGWADPDFDDSSWGRVRGRLGPVWGGSSAWQPGNSGALSVLFGRGKFRVSDPKACKGLQVHLRYHGGVIVRINGTELKRKHLPNGKINFDTLAERYKRAAYLKPDGRLLHPKYDTEEYADHTKLYRERKLGAVIPEKMLRKGVNVIAVEVHRAPLHEVYLTGKYHKLPGGTVPGPFAHAALITAAVRTTKGETPGRSVEENLARPEGVQVWNSRIVRRIRPWDYGDPSEKLHAIRIPAVRGGSFNAQVAFGTTEVVEELEATVSDLKCPGGVIPASAVEVWYPKRDFKSFMWHTDPRRAVNYNTLWPKPPAIIQPVREYMGAVQPIWIKLRVPRDAAAGKYTGTLTINYKKGLRDINLKQQDPVKIPLDVNVHDWTLPRPHDYQTFMGFVQSPETVAMRYKVPLWSDAHFEYMASTFKLLAEIGNKAVYLPLITRTHFGNAESMLRFVRQKDGTLKPDFSVIERYMDMIVRCQGKPSVTVLYLWEVYTCTRRRTPDTTGKMEPMVTEVDPKTGKTKEIKLAKFGTAESTAFWTPIFKELRARMAKRGLEKTLMLGIHGDYTPIRVGVPLFNKIAPGLPWVWEGHPLVTRTPGGSIGYAATVWFATGPLDPRYDRPRFGRRQYGSRRKELACQFHRALRGVSLDLYNYRIAAEWNITGRQRGMGRLGADIWPVLPRNQGVQGTIIQRYPLHSAWWQLRVQTNFLSSGPNGALPSVHFEMLRQGVQDSEARIFIETALLDKALRAKLGEELAGRVQRVLDERTWMLSHGQRRFARTRTAPWFFEAEFTERENKLYAAAAAVTQALARK
jgi:glycosyl hydrolase family 123